METEKLKRIIAPVLGLLPEDLPEHADLYSEMGADSAEGFRIITALEEAFELEIPAAAAQRITSVSRAAEVLEELWKNGQ